MIHVNQIGYSVSAVKRALLASAAESFRVISAVNGETVLDKAAETARYSPSAEETVRAADFTELGEGKYYLEAEGERSAVFAVTASPYDELHGALLQSFQFHRCGEALRHEPWTHEVCHSEPALVYGAQRRLDVSGGWHDAGDYGRYTVPAAKAAADLLLAHELSARTPDPMLLTAVRYELDWIMKMLGTDGGAFHKVTCAQFCGMVQPDEERETLILSPVSATATGCAAAVLALASRVFVSRDPVYAQSLLTAARRAYVWLQSHPDTKPFHNPPEIQTGEYGDDCDRDERFWAAAEMYAATGETSFRDDARALGVQTGLGWRETGTYGSLALLFANGTPRADDDFIRDVRASLLDGAKAVMDAAAREPYGISLGLDFPWGSNMDTANNAVLLLCADRLEPNAAYREAAAEHLHYLLGRNAVGMCYVSGFGECSPKHIHHRPSEAAGKIMPGFLAGGPSSGLQDDYAREQLTGAAPQKRYVDDVRSYSTNETAIYWNSALYWLLAMLDTCFD